MNALHHRSSTPGQTLERSHIRYVQPVLSSDESSWERLELGLFSKSAFQVSEHRLTYHNMCINYGGLAKLPMVVNGKSATKTIAPATVGLFPAELWQAYEWREQASFLCLYLDPVGCIPVLQDLG